VRSPILLKDASLLSLFLWPQYICGGIRHYEIICQDTPLHFGLNRGLFKKAFFCYYECL
jgi:hypothetical protein